MKKLLLALCAISSLKATELPSSQENQISKIIRTQGYSFTVETYIEPMEEFIYVGHNYEIIRIINREVTYIRHFINGIIVALDVVYR